jgi:hypothetical protein
LRLWSVQYWGDIHLRWWENFISRKAESVSRLNFKLTFDFNWKLLFFLIDEDSQETKILHAKILARLGQETEVDEFVQKFDLGNSGKIVQAILMRSKKRVKEALTLIEEFFGSSKRYCTIFFLRLFFVRSLISN